MQYGTTLRVMARVCQIVVADTVGLSAVVTPGESIPLGVIVIVEFNEATSISETQLLESTIGSSAGLQVTRLMKSDVEIIDDPRPANPAGEVMSITTGKNVDSPICKLVVQEECRKNAETIVLEPVDLF